MSDVSLDSRFVLSNLILFLPALAPQKPQDVARPKSRDAISIHHLLNAPDYDDLIGRFPIRDTSGAPVGEDDDGTLGDHEDSSDASHWSEEYEQNDVFIGAEMPDYEVANFESFFGNFETLTFGAFPLTHYDLSQMTRGGGIASSAAMALEPRAYEVRQLLLATATKLANEYPGHPQIAQWGPAIELVTHVELDHCLGLYFSNYHRHCPILHRPSFQPTIVPIALLLPAVALGAMYSPEPLKVTWMKSLLDVMEAYVFSMPGLKEDYLENFSLADAPDEDTLNYHFQMFQGAYLMIVVQYFSGNLAGRRRARRQRFSSILGVCMGPLH